MTVISAVQRGVVVGLISTLAICPALTAAAQARVPGGQENGVSQGQPINSDVLRDQRKAASLYLDGVELLKKARPEAAWNLLKQAAALQPENQTFQSAAELARQSAVTQLVQQAAAKASTTNGQAPAEALLLHALEIDPKSPSAREHLKQLGLQTAEGSPQSSAMAGMNSQERVQATLANGPILLEPDLTTNGGKHSFHLRSNGRQAVMDVFRAFGIEASVHDSVQGRPIRMDVDDATFDQATRVLGLLTNTFYEPLDPHRVVVAQDTKENRAQFQRLQMETIYLPGLTEPELADMSNLARNLFETQQSVVQPSSNTVTVRAAPKTLNAFNNTVMQLIDGRNQVDLEVKIIQLAHTATRDTGTTFFQQSSVYNVYSEINSVLSQNQSLVQQIIASGLVPDANTLAHQIEILAILVASGQLTGTPFNQGFLPFGGGLTQSILSPGPATLNFKLNSSDTRTIDDIHLLLGDLDPGTFKVGERYPIETSSYSSLALTALAGVGATAQTIPQVEYQDLGLTLKATSRVLRAQDVALTLDLKIEALGGRSLNDIPILNSRQIAGVLTVKSGETAILVSDLTRQESRALSGLPGVSDIPGLKDVSDITRDQNVARLLILITPTVVRQTQPAGHGPMLTVDKGTTR